MAETFRIERLGHRGDGIATTRSGPVYVPLTLPGEVVEAECQGERAHLMRVVEASPLRVDPVCPHFGECGGCALQHMRAPNYLAWKEEQVRAALLQRGLDVPVAPIVKLAPRSRRRAVFAIRRAGKRIVVGYHARMSHRIVEVGTCPVVVPAIERALPGLAEWLAPLIPLKGETRLGVTATPAGLDVSLEGPNPRPPAIVPIVAAAANKAPGVARLSIAGDPVLVRSEPFVAIDGIEVRLPPLAFLQATEASEAALGRLVVEAVGAARSVADLFAGIGTFSLRLAREARVLAVEGDAAALSALSEATRRASGLKPVETLRRDLERQPMSAKELARFEAVVFDPPRAGAKAQVAELAGSKVPRVVAVSCNPATFARDLRTLVDGGYSVRRVVPVDQFLHSPHIEAVALLER